MTLKNTNLINLVNKLGEAKAAELLQSKLEHDAKQKLYHAKRNALQSALTREMTAKAKAAGMTLDQFITKMTAAA